jgi:hypothetical protein
MTGSSDKRDPDSRLNKPSSGFGFVEFESSKASRAQQVHNDYYPTLNAITGRRGRRTAL